MIELINKYLETDNLFMFLNVTEFKNIIKIMSTRTKKEIIQYFKENKLISALDILKLENISISDRFGIVFREELIPAHVLHEFGCRVAERALSKVENPDPRSLDAIKTKRLWMRGEATDEELKTAWEFAWYAAAEKISCHTAMDVAEKAAATAARNAAESNARIAAYRTVMDAADHSAEQQCQIEELEKILKKGKRFLLKNIKNGEENEKFYC